MERIRYIETVVPNILESRKVFYIGVKQYRVVLNTIDLTFKVLDLTTKEQDIVHNGSGKSLHDIKLKAKRALIGLGIQFADESRNRLK